MRTVTAADHILELVIGGGQVESRPVFQTPNRVQMLLFDRGWLYFSAVGSRGTAEKFFVAVFAGEFKIHQAGLVRFMDKVK